MTGPAPQPPDDEADLLAAEYVLGVLNLPQRVSAQARIRADAAFATRVAAWEARLAPLNEGFAEIAAPELLPQIERQLFPKPVRRRHGFNWFAGALSAVVLVLGVFLSLDQPAVPILTATLSADLLPLAFSARVDPNLGTLTLIRTGGEAPAPDHDLELWAIGADGHPTSLGVIRAAEETRAAPALMPGVILAITLEPAGGSPTGLPTGPVLVSGALTAG